MQNQLLTAPPPMDKDTLVVVAPWWFTVALRVFSLAFSLATAFLALQSWHDMPWWARGLALILAPAFAWAALHSRGWRRFSTDPFLAADRRGIYLPSLAPEAANAPRGNRWLLVPWTNIARLRQSKVGLADGSSTCAAMDVFATPEELREFFVGETAGDPAQDPQRRAVAFYAHRPPHPRRIIALLEQLSRKYGN